MDTQKQNLQQNNEEGAGRTHNSTGQEQPASQQKITSDISGIDQQEGNMNNGVVGDAGKENSGSTEEKH